jgi:ferredoxin
VTTTLSADGMYVFAKRNRPDKMTLTFNGNATQCSCRFWKAYHVQCSHLLLLHNGCSENLFSRRWFQLSELGTTVVDEEACDSAGTCSSICFDHGNDGINNDVVAVLGDGTNNDVVAALGEHQALRFMTSSARRLGFEQY